MFQYHHSSSSYQVQQSSYYKAYEPPYYSIPILPQPLFIPTQRRTGRVKFFNLNKGYGFIIPTDINPSNNMLESQEHKEEEVFVHHTSILNASKGYVVGLNKGEEVEFDLCDGPKGIYALYVTGPKGIPLQSNPYYSNHPITPNSNSPTTSNLHPLPEYHHAKSAYPALYQQPYVTYIIPAATTTTATATSSTPYPIVHLSNSSSHHSLIAYY